MKWLPQLLLSRSDVSDEQAMRALQISGDHGAFTILVRRWETPIRRLCVRMTGDEHRGEDLTQEAFIRVFANRRQFEHGRKFSTWLWRIALNLCFEEARRAGGRGEQPLEADLKNAPLSQFTIGDTPEICAIERERAELVRVALSSLPETYRVVVILREYEGLKCREIAELLEIPEGTVKWRMAEALTQLGQRLRPLLSDGPRQA